MMTPLEDLSFPIRLLLTLIIVLIVAFALMLLGAQAEIRDRSPSSYQRELLQLDKEAVKEAYKEQVRKLFTNWVVDSTGQPERMTVGLRNAQAAYIGAMVEINKYEQELGR